MATSAVTLAGSAGEVSKQSKRLGCALREAFPSIFKTDVMLTKANQMSMNAHSISQWFEAQLAILGLRTRSSFGHQKVLPPELNVSAANSAANPLLFSCYNPYAVVVDRMQLFSLVCTI
jgi:hypothetical protein